MRLDKYKAIDFKNIFCFEKQKEMLKEQNTRTPSTFRIVFSLFFCLFQIEHRLSEANKNPNQNKKKNHDEKMKIE